MLQIHSCDGFGDAGWFAKVQFSRTACLNGAEAAGARANISENHDRRRSSRPAFAHIRALRTLANSVQVVRVDDLADLFVFGTCREFGAQPFRLSIAHG